MQPTQAQLIANQCIKCGTSLSDPLAITCDACEKADPRNITVWHVTRKSCPESYGYLTDSLLQIKEERETDSEYDDPDDVIVEEVIMDRAEWEAMNADDAPEFPGW